MYVCICATKYVVGPCPRVLAFWQRVKNTFRSANIQTAPITAVVMATFANGTEESGPPVRARTVKHHQPDSLAARWPNRSAIGARRRCYASWRESSSSRSSSRFSDARQVGPSVFPRPVYIPAVEEQKIRAAAASLSSAHMVKAGGVTIPFGGASHLHGTRASSSSSAAAARAASSAPPRRRGARSTRKQIVPGAKGADGRRAHHMQRRPVCPSVPPFCFVLTNTP